MEALQWIKQLKCHCSFLSSLLVRQSCCLLCGLVASIAVPNVASRPIAMRSQWAIPRWKIAMLSRGSSHRWFDHVGIAHRLARGGRKGCRLVFLLFNNRQYIASRIFKPCYQRPSACEYPFFTLLVFKVDLHMHTTRG